MPLRVDRPVRNAPAEESVNHPTQSAEKQSGHVGFGEAFGGGVVGVDVVFVDAGDAEETEEYVMEFETDVETDNGMEDCE